MRAKLEAKTNEGDKKIDKRIEGYMLRHRPKESDSILTAYREDDGHRSDTVAISIEHMTYYLENHSWLKNSLLLFNVYHRF